MTKQPARPIFTTNIQSSNAVTLPYRSRKKLLSDGERRFYQTGLKPAIEDRYEISMKVSLTDVITVPKKLWDTPVGFKIRQRHIDFVLCTKRALSIIAAVELDDASHLCDVRRAKDDFLGDALLAAGIPLLRFPIYRRYDPEKIRKMIFDVLRRFPKSSSER